MRITGLANLVQCSLLLPAGPNEITFAVLMCSGKEMGVLPKHTLIDQTFHSNEGKAYGFLHQCE